MRARSVHAGPTMSRNDPEDSGPLEAIALHSSTLRNAYFGQQSPLLVALSTASNPGKGEKQRFCGAVAELTKVNKQRKNPKLEKIKTSD